MLKKATRQKFKEDNFSNSEQEYEETIGDLGVSAA